MRGVGGLLDALPAGASAAPSGLPDDFNGDGYRDLAVSAPGAVVAGKAETSVVVVHYGSPSGISALKRKPLRRVPPALRAPQLLIEVTRQERRTPQSEAAVVTASPTGPTTPGGSRRGADAGCEREIRGWRAASRARGPATSVRRCAGRDTRSPCGPRHGRRHRRRRRCQRGAAPAGS
ncbi:FG-GAP repeat protein [Streptomyces sp. NPDC002640]